MSHSYTILAATFIAFLLFGCQKEQKGTENNTVESNVSETSKKTIVLESFTEYPPEIDGCSCTFASDSAAYSQDKHIYVNDFAATAFVKINGKLILCEQISYENKDNLGIVAKYKAGNYRMTVTTKDSRDVGDESSIMTGSIKIEDDKGNTSEQPFYGICGC
jgi:hypothetical protein